MSDTKFSSDYSKRISKCQKCKQEIPKGSVRLAKLSPNFFHDGDGEMKSYFHIKCLFESFQRAKATTKVIEATDDIEGFSSLQDDDKNTIIDLITNLDQTRKNKGSKIQVTVKKAKKELESEDDEIVEKKKVKKLDIATNDISIDGGDTDIENENETNIDNKFETFSKLCDRLTNQSGHIAKTKIVHDFIVKGSDGKKYKGDLNMFIHMLLPNSKNRVYNLNSILMIKLFSRLFKTDQNEMTKHLNQNGDISETIKTYFEESTQVKPLKQSKLTLKQVDNYLNELTTITKEQEQIDYLKKVSSNCTSSDLRTIIRLIKKDLRINAGEKAILDAITPNAYDAFKVSRDLDDVIKRSIKLIKEGKEVDENGKPSLKKDLSIKITLMKAVKPMLAEACKSVESAIKKCTNGIYAEIKYDGERLQVHKNGNKFEYFSRNLKPVQAHKVSHLKEFIPKAFPAANDLILDGEVLLYDTNTKKPLPFGTLGKHKKNAFKDATVCLFIFDCLYYNGKDLMNLPLSERRVFLQKTMKEIPGHIMLSEQHLITKADKLRELMMHTIKEGLEGLVLKDTKSIYEPGKRHWLKMKKDYLDSGSMADTADLVCLGAYYGTGNKGGLMSVFLMGVYNQKADCWQTVTKCGNGFDDKTLDKLQKDIQVVEINKNAAKVPSWLDVNRSIVPDFVVKDPKKAPVWEITGAEFSNSDVHTAGGISIRFPRVTRIRDDKTWKEATDLERLKTLFKISKEKSDIDVSNTSKDFNESIDEINDNGDDIKNKKKDVIKKAPKRASNNYDDDDDDDDIKVEVKKLKKKDDVDNSLPSVFENCKIFLPQSCDDYAKLKRYIIAYDGEVVDDYSIEDATHIVVVKNNDENELKKINENKKAKRISLENLWKSIKTKKILN